MSKIIFNEETRDVTEIHDVTGCEKMIMVRGTSPFAFTLNINSMALSDPHKRRKPLTTVTSSDENICIGCCETANFNIPCVACGEQLEFQLSGVDPNAHVFVEILDDTCVPEKCCNC